MLLLAELPNTLSGNLTVTVVCVARIVAKNICYWEKIIRTRWPGHIIRLD